MTSLLARIAARRQYRRTVDALSALSDHQLADVGIRRFDIPRLAVARTVESSQVPARRAPVPAGLALAR